MRILGTGKIDDFQKVVLSKKVMKALGVKSGDSILFSRYAGKGSVQMFKAEGACITSEMNSAGQRGGNFPRNKVGKNTILFCVVLSFVFLLTASGIFETDPGFEFSYKFESLVAIWVIMLFLLIIAYADISGGSDREETDTFISVIGPMGNDRIIGLSKILSDGYVASGTAYFYPMFGSNPSKISAKVEYNDGKEELVIMKCIRDSPGVSAYKMKIPQGDLLSGLLKIRTVYEYSDKAILADATYKLSCNENDKLFISVSDAEMNVTVHFDNEFQKAKFDESLFDPLDDDITI